MIFNSFSFIIFFPIFFLLYWFVTHRSIKLQNILILTGSYLVYAWWDWRFLFLLAGSSVLSFLFGQWIGRSQDERQRRMILILGLTTSLATLFIFKYFNFFIASLRELLELVHLQAGIRTLNIILPLGISFYTFRMISYWLDIYHERTAPCRDWLVYLSYIAYFPSLLSGPIDRSGTLVPQLENPRNFSYSQSVDGLRQILWGYFKKLAIADNCAYFTDLIFDNYTVMPGSAAALGMFMFTIQLYADFSGYSDMAIGFSNLLGIRITKNFNYPFFARNIMEFWRRWHISLTSWFTDYLYTPLALKFRNRGKIGQISAVMINFMVMGIWHGANWTFIAFGLIHGCLFVPAILRGVSGRRDKPSISGLPSGVIRFANSLITFILVMVAFVFFRAPSLPNAVGFIGRLFSSSILSIPLQENRMVALWTLICILIMLVSEWIQQKKDHALQIEGIRSVILRYAIYYGLILLTVLMAVNENPQFIYFQF